MSDHKIWKADASRGFEMDGWFVEKNGEWFGMGEGCVCV